MRSEGKISLALIVGLFLLLAALRLGFILMESQEPQAPPLQTRAATLLPELRPLPPFSLIDSPSRVAPSLSSMMPRIGQKPISYTVHLSCSAAVVRISPACKRD